VLRASLCVIAALVQFSQGPMTSVKEVFSNFFFDFLKKSSSGAATPPMLKLASHGQVLPWDTLWSSEGVCKVFIFPELSHHFGRQRVVRSLKLLATLPGRTM